MSRFILVAAIMIAFIAISAQAWIHEDSFFESTDIPFKYCGRFVAPWIVECCTGRTMGGGPAGCEGTLPGTCCSQGCPPDVVVACMCPN